MILGLDHIVLLTPDLSAGVSAYETLLGLAPAWRARGEGAQSAVFTLANVSLELLAPAGPGGERAAAALAAQGEGLASLAFQVDDIARIHRRLERVGLAPEEVVFAESVNADGAIVSFKRTRAATERTRGVRLFFVQLDRPRRVSTPSAPAPVLSIDHVVVASGDAERAAALYGARLGLDMTFDQRGSDGAPTLMFFRCADMIVEVMQTGAAASDRLWGLSWRVADIGATHARLAAAGRDVSEIRVGRRPGTEVFTVRDGTCNTPTLMIAPARGA